MRECRRWDFEFLGFLFEEAFGVRGARSEDELQPHVWMAPQLTREAANRGMLLCSRTVGAADGSPPAGQVDARTC